MDLIFYSGQGKMPEIGPEGENSGSESAEEIEEKILEEDDLPV